MANGRGWGGVARGASVSRRHKLTGAGPGRGNFSVAGEAREQRNERIAEEMCELYYSIALDVRQPSMVRVHAAERLLNRIEGTPVKRETNGTNEVRIVIEGGLPDRNPS